MKTKHLLKTMALTITLLLAGKVGWGQPLLVENFDYPTGQLTDVNAGANVSGGNWVNYSGTALPLMVSANSLTYSGYIASGIGNKVETWYGSAEDAYRSFTPQTAGTITYVAFLMNVSQTTGLSANSSTTGDYTISLMPSTSTSILVGRVSLRMGSVANTFNVGIRATSSNSSATWITTDLPINTPILVVLKYELVSGNTNDVASLWVNPAIGTAEPTADITQTSALTTDPTDLGRLTIRQGTNSFPGQIDGIRVATSWAEAVTGIAPSWTAGYPTLSNIEPDKATLTVNTNEPGKAYYVVLPDGAAAPSAAQVKAGTDATNTPVTLSGSVVISSASTDFTATISGLTAATDYDVYVVAEDDEAAPILQTSPVMLNLRTADPDLTAPSWTSGYPKVEDVANNDFNLKVNADEEGTAYYVVLADGSPAPTAAQVKAGTDGSDNPAFKSGSVNITSANTEFVQNVAGLTAGTTYDVYVVAEDAYNNLQASASAIADITTTNILPEPTNHATAFAVSGTVQSTQATLTWVDAVAGTQAPEGYLIVVNTTGTFTDPVDGTPIANDTDFADDAGAVNVANGVQTFTFNTLLPGKTYYARIYPYTNSGAAINYKTDGTVPEVSFGTPMILVTSPNGGERFFAGDELPITWTTANFDPAETIKSEAYVRQGLTSTWDWIELAPALPNTGSLNFTIPTDAKYGTQYKIRLTGNTSGVSDESDNTFTIIATPTIFDIQADNTGGASNWANDSVRIGGIVTAVTSKNYYLQAGTGIYSGIYVYYNTTHTYQPGDSLIVVGKVVEYNNLTELSTLKAATIVNTGNPLPSATAISTLNANLEDYESVLVKVTGATCNSGSAGTYVVNDGSGDLVVYKSIYTGLTLEVGRKYDITGVMGWYNTTSTRQLYPRSADDIYLYSNDAKLSDLKVDGVTVSGFDPATLTYNVELPYGTTIVPTVTYTLNDAKATAIKTDAVSLPGATTVAVTSEDGNVSQTYTINFTVAAPNTEANILTYTVAGVNATINNVNHTITATVPYSTDITNLVATFTLSDGATAKVGGVDQVSGTTANDFTNPVTYTVTAQDGTTTQDWTVTITKAAEPNHQANITAYSINGVDGVINEGAHTISVTLPYGTDVTALVATFTLSTGATAKVGTVDQVSGTTANDFTNPVTYTVTAEDGTTTLDWTVTVIVTPASTAKDIVSFTFGGELSSVIDVTAGTVTIVMPYGTDVTNLTPVISISEFATIVPTSGVAQDFTNPVTYTVTAQDGTTKVWTVSVSVAKNTQTDIITYSINGEGGSIDNVNHTVDVTLPHGTDVTSLTAEFTLSGGATAKVGTVDQVSGVTPNDFTNPVVYTITAEDGTTTQDWTVTVTIAAPQMITLVGWTFPNNPDDAIADEGIAENLNRTLTCTASGSVQYNVTGVDTYAATNTGWDNGVDTKYWMVELTTLGYENTRVYSAQRSSSTGPRDFKLQYQVNNSGNWIDVPGATNIVVASDFVSGVVNAVPLPAECDNKNLVSLRWVVSSTVAVNGGTVASTGTNRIDNIYVRGYQIMLSNNATVSSLVYTVNNAAGTITNVPQTETLASFKANITPAEGATFEVYQADGTTVATDLQTGYKLICTAEDGVTKKTYTITLNTTLSSEKAILSYSINGVAGTIDAVNHTVTLTLPYGTDRSNLVATFILSAAANAKVGTTPQVSGVTANDFTSPVTYTVTAEDGSTQDWVVTVNLTAPSSEKGITSFTIAGQISSDIDNVAGTVTVVMPYGTDLTSLVPTITVSQYATISPASGVAQDFTNPVVYTVTAQDGSTQDWVVTVNLTAPSSEKGITSFTIAGQISSDIDNVAGTVTVVMPYGTNLTNLVPTITVSQYATISPASGVAQDFTNPVVYTVTAQDGSTRDWTVTVTIEYIQLTKIFEIQYTTNPTGDSPLKGQRILTKGVVTAVLTKTSTFNFWLQDSAKAWNGVYVYGVNNSLGSVAQGDSVEVIGTVDEYNNLTEVKSVTYLKVLNSGNAMPAPVEISVSDAGSEAYEGVLVKLLNVECTVVDAGYGEFTVSDGTNTINIDDFLYKYTPVQGSRYNITGIVDYSFNAYKVLPRGASDIESAQVKYTVTFTVKRADGTTVVPDATINVTGQGNITTDVNGQATMQLPDGSYTYTVIKTGFNTFSDNFTVNGANLSVPVTLIMTGIPTSPISKLNVYPNPFANAIYFTGSEVTRITITSVIGQVVMDRQVENTESIDVSTIERGIYLVRFYNSKGESVLRKMVKE